MRFFTDCDLARCDVLFGPCSLSEEGRLRTFVAYSLVLALVGAPNGIAVRNGIAGGFNDDRDYQFLRNEFGFSRDGFVLKNISAPDAVRLQRVKHDPVFAARPEALRLNLATLLLDVERNTCHGWEQTYHNAPCPEVGDPGVTPGWAVAERRCIACHLTGTTNDLTNSRYQPSFLRFLL